MEGGGWGGAFVLCCWDICLLSHPSSEPQGGSQCHPLSSSLPPSLCCLQVLAKALSSPAAWRPGQPSPSAWLVPSVCEGGGLREGAG